MSWRRESTQHDYNWLTDAVMFNSVRSPNFMVFGEA